MIPSATIATSASPGAAARLDRVATRVPHEVKQRWIQAAQMRGQSLTDFIIVAANSAVTETFAEHQAIILTQRDSAALANLLENPPPLSTVMQEALRERLS